MGSTGGEAGVESHRASMQAAADASKKESSWSSWKGQGTAVFTGICVCVCVCVSLHALWPCWYIRHC